jgi:hypothetical protein
MTTSSSINVNPRFLNTLFIPVVSLQYPVPRTQTATACHTQTDKSGHGNRGESFVAVLEESVGVRCRFDENQLRKALA